MLTTLTNFITVNSLDSFFAASTVFPAVDGLDTLYKLSTSESESSISCTELAFSHARITSFKPQQRQWVCEWKSDRWGKVLMGHGFGENKGPLAIFKEDLAILRAPNSAQYCPNLLLQRKGLLWIYWMCVSQRPQLSQLLWNNSAYHKIPIWQGFS